MSCSIGVPQGSVLGPTLFKIFINDMNLCTNLETSLFADDTTYFANWKAKTDNQLLELIQKELKSIEDWFQSNELTLHPSKTVIMNFSKNKTSYIDTGRGWGGGSPPLSIRPRGRIFRKTRLRPGYPPPLNIWFHNFF